MTTDAASAAPVRTTVPARSEWGVDAEQRPLEEVAGGLTGGLRTHVRRTRRS